MADETPSLLAGRSVAIVNEWFEATGGAEQVLLQMAELIPHASVFVSWKSDNVAGHDRFRESWLARTPLRHRKALSIPVMPLMWRTLTRQRFDVVISLSHLFAHTVKLPRSPQTSYLSYVHSPARYIWSPELDRRGSPALLRGPRRLLQTVDTYLSRHVHGYAVNSREVQQRVRRYWGREANIVHPPVDVSFYADAPPADQSQERRHLLGVGRWVPYKNFDLMIEIATRARLPLVLAGGGPEETRLRQRARASGAQVRFVVGPSDDELRTLYWGARALLYTGHEDFGIIPVEAQACHTPVVGVARGGLLETVMDGKTGFLVDSLEPSAFAAAILRLDQLADHCYGESTSRFTLAAFRQSATRWINSALNPAAGRPEG